MSLASNYTQLLGGMDLISGPFSTKPGMLGECVNFEQTFGRVGYRRIDGYERFDGRPQPHKAQYLAMKVTGAPTVHGDMIAGLTGNGIVLGVGDGLLIFCYTDGGGFAPGQTLTIGAQTVTVTEAPHFYRASTMAQHHAWLRQAQAQLRAPIQKVPGAGPVLGVAVYGGYVIAVRNAADGKTSQMWKSSGAGWQSVKAGLRPGGTYDFSVANFSGDAKRMSLFGADGKNPPFRYDENGYTAINGVYGSQATSASSVAVGTGTKTFVIVEAGRSWAVGETVEIHSAANASNFMVGTVTSYATMNLVVNVTAVGGSGTFTDWVVGLNSGEDIPYLVTAHKDHLFLAYPRGQLQSSNLGDPMKYDSTAVSIGTGDEITGLLSMRGAVLGVICRRKVYLLQGSSKSDWQMNLHSDEIGAVFRTAQSNVGNALMMSPRGLISLQATQNFGGFEPAVWSRNVQPLLDGWMASVICTRMSSKKYQYRMYFKGGDVLSACIMSPAAMVAPSDVGFTRSQYLHEASCVADGALAGEDAILFGSVDGWVMREDVGQSFDGQPIEASLRLHFNNMKSPQIKKRFRKITIEADAPEPMDVRTIQLFDLGNDTYRRSIERAMAPPGTGGQWDVSQWDAFAWSLPIQTQMEVNVDGLGTNMSLLMWCKGDVEQPITLQGLLTIYSPLGLSR